MHPSVLSESRAGARLIALVALVLPALAAPQGVANPRAAPGAEALGCAPAWLPTFGPHPGQVSLLVEFDDGSGAGPRLHAAGTFASPTETAPVLGVARRAGAGWELLAEFGGFAGPAIQALAVHDDGDGPALYVGGSFDGLQPVGGGSLAAPNFARWNGTSWSRPAPGTSPVITALVSFDDGSGPALFAAGATLQRWSGAGWSLVSGPNASVSALQVHDDGAGPALFVGGSFTSAGGVPASRVARWDGSSWTALGSGLSGTNATCLAFTVLAGGSGPLLVAGGIFTAAGGLPASNIAAWDGSSWSALGAGLNAGPRLLLATDALAGPELYAAGPFTSAGGAPAPGLARWDGSAWSSPGGGLQAWTAGLVVHDDGTGPALHARGTFSTPGGSADLLGRWSGAGWTLLGRGLDGTVSALLVHDDGSGPALHAGGWFGSAGASAARRIARWDGAHWQPLGSGIGGGAAAHVGALAEFDDGSGGGPALYAAGEFASAGGVTARGIARWDGAGWAPLGSGITARVTCLAVFDDGSGPALYAGGNFTSAGGVAASRIARWDGASWGPLGSGTNSWVQALAVFDDGGGPALYAAGDFSSAGGLAVNRIARWDGNVWSVLPGNGANYWSTDLAVFDDGSGPALYLGGAVIHGGSTGGVTRWDGSGWSLVGGPMSGTSPWVFALEVLDDGTGAGPALYAGGRFTGAGGVAASRLARWDGGAWQAVGNGLSFDVNALAVVGDGSGAGQALVAGGGFTYALDSGDAYVAWLQACPDTQPPVLACPPSIEVLDELGGPAGRVVTFAVGATDSADPAPDVVCVPPSGSVFPRGSTLVTCTATDAAGNQASCEFTVTVRLRARRR